MFVAPPSPYLVPFNGKFKHTNFSTHPPDKGVKKKKLKNRLKECTEELAELQKVLYAHDRYSLLLIFQAMDAGGKDSTIRAVMSGVNPAGCQVFSFKQPSAEALDHDFLWRSSRRLPERGRIGILTAAIMKKRSWCGSTRKFWQGSNCPGLLI